MAVKRSMKPFYLAATLMVVTYTMQVAQAQAQAQDTPIHPYLENTHLFSVGAIRQIE